MKPRKTNDPAFLAVLMSEIHNNCDDVPDGYFSIEQWNQKWKCKRADRFLKTGLKNKLFDRKMFRVQREDGIVAPKPLYKFIGKLGNKANLTKPLKKTK